MAAVNRFTNIRANDYNPMSLQELMLVPQYKRTQHDNLLESASAIDTAIAQVDPLAIHNNAARKEQDRLRDNINNQVELLNSEGFNPSSKSAFLRLNSDFQQSVSPTGTLGRINQAKEILNKNKQAHIENAIKQGFSAEDALRNWDDFENRYTERYLNTGNIENIGELYSPNYVDYVEEARKLFKDAGITSADIATGGGRIVQDERGTYVVNTKNRDVSQSNIKQLQAAVDFLNNRINNPQSDIYKSFSYQGKTSEDVLNELSGLADVFVKSSTSKQRESSINSFRAADSKGQDANGGNMFLNHMLRGTQAKGVDVNSPIVTAKQFVNAEYDGDGNLVQGSGKYATFEEKVEGMKEDYNVYQDKETGRMMAVTKASGNAGVGSVNKPFAITRDPIHMANDLNKIRNDNPSLQGLSDKELVDRLNSFDQSIESNYVNSITVPDTNYEWMNDRLFGNRKGKGEDSTGIFLNNGATVDGSQLTASEVVEELGYDSTKEFKEEGSPAIQGFVTALGKWHVAAQDKDGNAVDMFIDAPQQIVQATRLTREMTNASFEGKAFKDLGRTPNGNASIYFVNDFVEPRIVIGVPGAESAKQIQSLGESKTMSEVNAAEKAGLARNPLYRKLLGLKDE